MVFSSFTFIFIFLLTSLVVYHIVPYRFKNYILLIISLLFYAWGEPVYIILMVLSILFNYLCGQYIAMLRPVTPVKKSGVIPKIEIMDVEKEYTVRGFQTQVKEKRNLQKRAKMSLSAAITFNLLILGFFKYFDFAMTGITHVSQKPLRGITFIGFTLSAVSMAVAIIFLIIKLVRWNDFQMGMAPVVIGLFFFGSVQLAAMGVIGEYIGAILIKVTRRPMVVEEERINFDGEEKAYGSKTDEK